MSIVSNQLFDTHKVLVFKIPPGEVTLPRWDTKEQNVVWKGNLRLIEEEETIEDEIEKEPYELLRLKLEFYNADKADPLLDNIEGFDKSQVWAEAWFNPFREQGIDWAIANDKDDTIKMTPESPKYYKVVLQLPGSGYHPFSFKMASKKQSVLQIALGLKFEDSFNAMSFSESLGIYRRRFKAFHEKFLYDQHLTSLHHRIINELNVSDRELREHTPVLEDDDEFGNFVGSSYD